MTIAAAAPAPVQAPSFKVGDLWVFDQTDEQGHNFNQQRLDYTVERTSRDTMLIGVKRDGAPTAYEDHLVGSDWSLRLFLDGKDTTTARPYTFPMRVGQTWTVDFIDPTRRGAQKLLHVHRTYKVVGWEDVTVPAGTFHAIKVEASGLDQGTMEVPNVVAGSATISSNGAQAISRSQRGGQAIVNIKHQSEFYYVPEVRNNVKNVEEQFNSDDVLVNRRTQALVSFRPGA